jgi:hypothetical protein
MLEWIYKHIIKKIDLPVILIIFIILCILFSDKREGFKEGIDVGGWFKDLGKKIEDAGKELINSIEKRMGEFVELLKRISPERIAEELRKPFDSLGDFFKKGINDAKGGFSKIGKDFDGPIGNIFSKLKRLLLGYIEILQGIGLTYFGVNAGMWLGFNSSTLLLIFAGEYFITNFLCGLRFLVFLPACAFFYLADLVGQILYFPIQLLLGFLYAAGASKIYTYEKYFWKQVRGYDNLFCDRFGFYLTRWPKNIRDQCYNCKRLKFRILREKADEIGTFNDKVVFKTTMSGLNHLIDGVKDMVGTISDILHGR